MPVTAEEMEHCFPYPEARPGQLEVCVEIVNKFLDGVTDVVLEGPTGTGKSAVGMCVAMYLSEKLKLDGFCTTSLKTLQNQYRDDSHFDGLFYPMKGKSSYQCPKQDSDRAGHFCDDWTMEEAARIRAVCKKMKVCPYFIAIENANKHSLILNNMHALIYQGPPFSTIFENRDFLIIDECHTTENALMGLFSFNIDQSISEKYRIYEGWLPIKSTKRVEHPVTDSFVRWISAIHEQMTDILENQKHSWSEGKCNELSSLAMNVGEFLKDPSVWICESEVVGKKNLETYTFKPLTVKNYAHLIKGKGERYRLWMSATILDNQAFCESLDIDHTSAHYIRMKSLFPPENNPVFIMGNQFRSSAKTESSTYPLGTFVRGLGSTTLLGKERNFKPTKMFSCADLCPRMTRLVDSRKPSASPSPVSIFGFAASALPKSSQKFVLNSSSTSVSAATSSTGTSFKKSRPGILKESWHKFVRKSPKWTRDSLGALRISRSNSVA